MHSQKKIKGFLELMHKGNMLISCVSPRWKTPNSSVTNYCWPLVTSEPDITASFTSCSEVEALWDCMDVSQLHDSILCPCAAFIKLNESVQMKIILYLPNILFTFTSIATSHYFCWVSMERVTFMMNKAYLFFFYMYVLCFRGTHWDGLVVLIWFKWEHVS